MIILESLHFDNWSIYAQSDKIYNCVIAPLFIEALYQEVSSRLGSYVFNLLDPNGKSDFYKMELELKNTDFRILIFFYSVVKLRYFQFAFLENCVYKNKRNQ